VSRPGEKLCQCGYALGHPGPPSVRFRGRDLPEYVHDLSGAVEVVTSVLCPCCGQETRWSTDARAVRLTVDAKQRGLS